MSVIWQSLQATALGIAALVAAVIATVAVAIAFNMASSVPPTRGETSYWSVLSWLLYLGIPAVIGLYYGHRRGRGLNALGLAIGLILSALAMTIWLTRSFWPTLATFLACVIVMFITTIIGSRLRRPA